MKKLNIGILGLALDTGNKGCEALSYSFFAILSEIAIKNHFEITINILSGFPTKRLIKEKFNVRNLNKYYNVKFQYQNLDFEPAFYKKIKKKYFFSEKIKKLDCVYDFTAGDSFTDLYGKERFYTRTALKQALINQNIPLVLGSQTIGPFESSDVKQVALRVINEAFQVYVRDEKSFDFVKKNTKRLPVLTSDVALLLPYIKQNASHDKIKIGFNPSGLLWNGGYERNNQFRLKTDYQDYCKKIISYCIEQQYEVYLILHAYSTNLQLADNDLVAVKALKEIFPNVIVSPQFDTAVDAKSYISGMDLFIGARMHATIAAISSGVPVIPFSYSRKFEGLFESLKYNYVVSATKIQTEESVNLTIEYINSIEKIKENIEISTEIIKNKNKILLEQYESLLNKLGACNEK